MKRRCLITGAAGQDGYYLTQHLQATGREVLGLSIEASRGWGGEYVCMDVANREGMQGLIRDFAPHEIYHLAAYHRSSSTKLDISASQEEERYFKYNVEATRGLLGDAAELPTDCRVFLAASSHIFGNTTEFPQTEASAVRPNTVYGITKAMNLWMGQYYRHSRGLFCVTGILYNHESPRRGPSFVTGRIARTVCQIARGEASELLIGNLDAQVDWGYAGDYVRAMTTMLEADSPRDCIIASGRLHTVRDFVRLAFERVGLDYKSYVRESESVHRPVSSSVYFGDTTSIAELGYRPEKTFEELVQMMVDEFR